MFTPDFKNRMPGLVSLAKNCNAATHEGDTIDSGSYLGPMRAGVIIGAPTGTPDAGWSVVVTILENTTDDLSGDTQLTDIDEVDGAGVDSLTLGVADIGVVHFLTIENAKRYLAGKAVVTLANGSSPAIPVTIFFFGEKQVF